MANVGFVSVQVVPVFRGMGAKLTEGMGGPAAIAGRKAGEQAATAFGAGLRKGGKAITAAGRSMTLGLTLPLLGVGFAAFKAADDFTAAAGRIRFDTGKTGADLAGLKAVFESVNRVVPQTMGEVAGAVAELNRRTGLTGDALGKLAKQFLDLSDNTGADVIATISSVTRVFGDWHVASNKQSDALDRLFRVSQATGLGVGELSDSLVKFGAPLRQMGFNLTDSALILGKFEREGVNSGLVMGSLRIALGKISKSGEPVIETFKRVVKSIKEAGTVGKANAIALEFFGARAGPDMAAAIREGRFEIDALAAAVAGSTDTIDKADAAADTAGERLKMLGKRIAESLVPVGESIVGVLDIIGPHIVKIADAFGRLSPQTQAWIAIVGGILAAVGPIVSVVGKFVTGIGWLGKAFTFLKPILFAASAAVWNFTVALLANPIGLIVVAIIALIAVFVLLWFKCSWFRDFWIMVWNGIKTAAAAVGSWFMGTFWGQWLKPAFTAIGAIALWLWQNILMPAFRGIHAVISVVMQIVRSFAALFFWMARAVLLPAIAVIMVGIRGFGMIFNWLWQNVIVPAGRAIGVTIRVLGAVFSWLWNNAIGPAVRGINVVIGALVAFFRARFATVMAVVRSVGGVFRSIFGAIGGYISSAFSRAVGVVRGAINGIISMVNGAIGFINGNMIGNLNKLPGVNFPSIPTVPHLYAGGTISGAGWATVGDRGKAEDIFLPRGAQVMPRQPGPQRGVAQRVSLDVTGADEDLKRVIRKWVRNDGRGSVQTTFGRAGG